MNGKYISYHCFNWLFGKYLFGKSIVKSGGEILGVKKEKGKYLVKVSNPSNNMSSHKNWYNSNINFFKQSFQTF